MSTTIVGEILVLRGLVAMNHRQCSHEQEGGALWVLTRVLAMNHRQCSHGIMFSLLPGWKNTLGNPPQNLLNDLATKASQVERAVGH